MKPKITSMFMLAMMNVAAICNIANLPVTAQYGFSSVFYYMLGAIAFFIPIGLVSAELATGWPERGGVYIWVREALGKPLGFLAIWLQWVENVIWYPTIMSFMAIAIAYIFQPSLIHSKVYIISTILVIFWSVTFLNFLGIKVSGWVSMFCVLVGTFLPISLFLVLDVIWFYLGNPLQIHFTVKELIPPMNAFRDYAVLAGLFVSFTGLEMSAVHAKDVENPQKNYPKAIFLSVVLILALLSLGALSIAAVVPSSEIFLGSGTVDAFKSFFDAYGISSWALPILCFLIAIGSFGTVSTWIIGPTKGILTTARNGELPLILQKTNKRAVPVNVLILQAIVVSILSFVFSFMPTLSSAYQALITLMVQLYLIMYILMFISAIVLRYKHPKMTRTFKVPFGNAGMWVVSILGILSSFFVFFTGFIPPSDLKQPGQICFFEAFLVTGTVVLCGIPFIINKMKKPEWQQTLS